jgi:hypothetical protein
MVVTNLYVHPDRTFHKRASQIGNGWTSSIRVGMAETTAFDYYRSGRNHCALILGG